MLFDGDNYHNGYLTFENFFGEELDLVHIIHHQSNFANLTRRKYLKEKILGDVPHQKVLEDIFYFQYELGSDTSYSFWHVKLRTKSGRSYETDGFFRCSLKQGDGGKVVMGVNGDSQQVYMHFNHSSDCSSHLFLLLD